MGFLDRLFGSGTTEAPAPSSSPQRTAARSARSDDEIAVERYRYLLRTAPPETIEQVHREAFATLTDDQRALIYEELSRGAQTGERPLSSEPATLARSATRAELRRPGTMERVLGSTGGASGVGRTGGPSFGSMVGSTLLGTVAGYVIGSALVSAFLPFDGGASQADAGDVGGSGSGDSGVGGSADANAGASGAGASSADFGGGWSGGDFGGGGGFGF